MKLNKTDTWAVKGTVAIACIPAGLIIISFILAVVEAAVTLGNK